MHGPGTDEPLVWYEGSGTSDRRSLHSDERGSVVALSDSAGNATAINRYDEFGIPGAANAGRFQYIGQTWMAERSFVSSVRKYRSSALRAVRRAVAAPCRSGRATGNASG